MRGKITITNQSQTVSIIDIEGEIGVPEGWQFENPGQRVATYERFRERVEELKKIEKAEVIVNIRSAGGDVNDAILILEALAELEGNITTRCFGYVASAATIIAQAASRGGREMSKNALYLIHKAACRAEGNHQELEQSLDVLRKTDERIAEIYAQRAGEEVEKYNELMAENGGKGRWLSPQETKKMGLIDRVIGEGEGEKDIEERVVNMGLPPIPEKMLSKIKNRERWRERERKIAAQWSAILEIVGIIGADKEKGEQAEAQTSAQQPPIVQVMERGKESEQGTDYQSEDYMDIKKEPTNESSGQELESSYEKSEIEVEIKSVERAQSEAVVNRGVEVENLKQRIEELERDNARMLVGATSTLPKEDPEIHGSPVMTPNQEAYSQDIQNFAE